MKHTRAGNGDYLVLVHGALADENMWQPHIERLKADYEVVAVSQRHFDGTNEGGFGLNTHADDLAEFLNPLCEEKPVNLVAWSYGADVVLNMMIRHTLSLSRIYLYEPGYPGCLSGDDMEKWSADAEQMFGPVFEFFSKGQLESAAEALINGSGNRAGYFMSQSNELKAQQLEMSKTLRYQLTQQEEPDITEHSLSTIKLLFSVSHGSVTRDSFRLISRKIASASNAASLKVIEGEGHMLPIDNPRKFSSIIKEQLKH